MAVPFDVTGRRVTVVGLARSGIAAARWLLDHGAWVTVTEAQATPETRRAAEQLRVYAALSGRMTVELGAHTRPSVEQADCVVVSPGVPETAPVVGWAEAAGAPVISEVELAARACPGPIVAVTGTVGKTTVTTLIGQLLRAGGRGVEVCGNIGRPFCDVVDRLRPDTVVVLEVSSFQLLRSPTIHPRVAVLLNLSENHLDRHPTLAAYAEAKARLFANQTPEDWAVLNAADPHVQRIAERVRAQVLWFNHRGSDRLPGERNPNYEAAAAAARVFDVPEAVLYRTLRDFRGLEHRLEPVATVRGVRFVNDSKSTTPASLRWALERHREPVILIVGGRNKGCDFTLVRETLARSSVKEVILLGECRQELRRAFDGVARMREVSSLDEAVRTAYALAQPGHVILLSPACASFDMFANYQERGQRFKEAVSVLERAVGLGVAPAVAALPGEQRT